MKKYSIRKKISKNSGFTLVEMIIAVAILSVIAAMSLQALTHILRTYERSEQEYTLQAAAQLTSMWINSNIETANTVEILDTVPTTFDKDSIYLYTKPPTVETDGTVTDIGGVVYVVGSTFSNKAEDYVKITEVPLNLQFAATGNRAKSIDYSVSGDRVGGLNPQELDAYSIDGTVSFLNMTSNTFVEVGSGAGHSIVRFETTSTRNLNTSLSNPATGPCFIATASFGSLEARPVATLRHFRDDVMLTNPVGQWLVNLYYTVSPPIADIIAENDALRVITMVILTPIVAVAAVMLEPALLVGALPFVVGFIMLRRFKKSGKNKVSERSEA